MLSGLFILLFSSVRFLFFPSKRWSHWCTVFSTSFIRFQYGVGCLYLIRLSFPPGERSQRFSIILWNRGKCALWRGNHQNLVWLHTRFHLHLYCGQTISVMVLFNYKLFHATHISIKKKPFHFFPSHSHYAVFKVNWKKKLKCCHYDIQKRCVWKWICFDIIARSSSLVSH